MRSQELLLGSGTQIFVCFLCWWLIGMRFPRWSCFCLPYKFISVRSSEFVCDVMSAIILSFRFSQFYSALSVLTITLRNPNGEHSNQDLANSCHIQITVCQLSVNLKVLFVTLLSPRRFLRLLLVACAWNNTINHGSQAWLNVEGGMLPGIPCISSIISSLCAKLLREVQFGWCKPKIRYQEISIVGYCVYTYVFIHVIYIYT